MKLLAPTLALLIGLGAACPSQAAEKLENKIVNDRNSVEAVGTWIYNDLPKGLAQARQTGKPLLVVLRCVP